MARPHDSAGALALAALALVTLSACGTAESAVAAERADSAGIEIVVNRGGDRPLDWSIERVFAVGGADEGPESFYRVGASSLAGDDAGDLYILDRGNHRVVVFDAAGRHVRTFGREGGGPGELQWPTSLVVSPDGMVGITDIGHRGLVRLTGSGEPLETRTLEGWFGGAVAAFDGGLVVQRRSPDLGDLSEGLTYMGPDGEAELLAVESPPTRPIDLGCVRISGMTQLFAPSLVWAAGPDRIAAATGAGYRIDLYDGGLLAASIRRDVPPRAATRALAIQEVGEKFEVSFGGGGGCSAPPDRVVDERGFADVVPAIRSMVVGPDGTLWVRRFAVKGDPAPIDVFAADGTYLGTLPDDAPFPATFLSDGRFAAVEKDEMDIEHVVVYRVNRDRG